ncbi:hypothetical protein VPNG_09790 [Cytospora leucostoma]|uniref:Uncharacterized protein n=1 Tax=Cytospora leucostoma TaxID=1230097 RepID=A0A423VGT5_9PEZI|nr:hypothetical protein VPNG_09790 [Cytospora leucostoma]
MDFVSGMNEQHREYLMEYFGLKEHPPPEVPPVEVPSWQNGMLFPEDLWRQFLKDCDWPAHKFGMKPKDMFTILPRHFNLIAVPLLDLDVFARDVMELSRTSDTKEEFFGHMGERQDQRRKEMMKFWHKAWTHLMLRPELLLKTWEGKHQEMRRAYEFGSFDAITRFLACHLPTEMPELPPLGNPDWEFNREDPEEDPKEDQVPSSPASMVTARTHPDSDRDTMSPVPNRKKDENIERQKEEGP